VPFPSMLLALTWTACDPGTGQDLPPTEDIDGAIVRFDPRAATDTTAGFFGLPWPLDTRRTADGHPAVGAHPRPDDHPASASLVSLVAETDGFSQVPVVVFGFDAAIATSRWDDGPLEGTSLALLVDVDPDSPDLGRTVPVYAHTPPADPYTPPNALTVSPVHGFVLRPSTTYAVVVDRDWGDGDGDPLGSPAALQAVLTDAWDADAALALAFSPLREVLPDLGVTPQDVAAATVFTTGDPVGAVRAYTEAVREAHDPLVEGMAVDSDGGADHARFCELRGTIDLPQFQDGTPPFDGTGGRFPVATDAPEVRRTDTVPVVITLPKETMPDGGWPVVYYAHGSDGLAAQVVDRGPVVVQDGEPTPGEGPAHVLASRGIAAVGMATLLAPERLGFDKDRAYLNLTNIGAYRDTWRQAQADVRLLFDALQDLEIPAAAVAACDGLSLPPGAAVHRLDTSSILGMGQSAGAHLITEVAAVDPRIEALVPTGSGGFWSLLLSGGSRVGGPPELIAFALGTEVEIHTLHPGLGLLQHAWGMAEPMVFAPALSMRPLDGHPRRHVYLPASAEDGFFPEPVYDAMALAYGLERTGPALWPELGERLDLAGLTDRPELPTAGNRDADGETWTGVVQQWAGDGLADSHGVFAQDEGLQHQYACFFETFLADGVPTVVAPGATQLDPCE